MNYTRAIPISQRIVGNMEEMSSARQHRYYERKDNNNNNDDFLSLDLPDETWEGKPCSDMETVASQRSTATRKSIAPPTTTKPSTKKGQSYCSDMASVASQRTTATRNTITATTSSSYQPSEENLTMSRKERAFVESLQRQWEGDENHQNTPMSTFMYLQFARFSNFYAKDAIKQMKEINPRYMKLSMKKLEAIIQTETLFPLPGLTTKNGTEAVYMKAARYFPRKLSSKYILDNLAYVLLSMAEREGPSSYGVCFIADMTDWTMENYSSDYWAELMKMLQGGVPVKVNTFLIVNPPGWFGTIMKVNKSLFSSSFARKVKTIQETELYQYLVKGFEEFLPTGFAGGRTNKEDIVEAFISSRLQVERKSKRKATK